MKQTMACASKRKKNIINYRLLIIISAFPVYTKQQLERTDSHNPFHNLHSSIEVHNAFFATSKLHIKQEITVSMLETVGQLEIENSGLICSHISCHQSGIPGSPLQRPYILIRRGNMPKEITRQMCITPKFISLKPMHLKMHLQ